MQRLEPAIGKRDQVLLQRIDADRVGDLEFTALRAFAARSAVLAALELPRHRAVAEHRARELSEHRVRGSLLHRARVLGILSECAATSAWHSAHAALPT